MNCHRVSIVGGCFEHFRENWPNRMIENEVNVKLDKEYLRKKKYPEFYLKPFHLESVLCCTCRVSLYCPSHSFHTDLRSWHRLSTQHICRLWLWLLSNLTSGLCWGIQDCWLIGLGQPCVIPGCAYERRGAQTNNMGGEGTKYTNTGVNKI